MATKLNIFEEEPLIKTLHILKSNEFGLGGLNTLNAIRLYPFEQLVQIHGLNHEIICYNAQIIEQFLTLDSFLTEEEYLKPSINFILSNLNFILKQENSLDTSYLLLNLFRKLLKRLNETYKFTISFSIICEIAKCVLQSEHVKNGKIKECLCSLLIEVARSEHYQSCGKAGFLNCVNSLLLVLGEDLVLGFQIIIEILSRDEFKNAKIESIYTFMELSIKEIKMSTDYDTLLNFLKCLHLVWKNCTGSHYIKRFFSNTLKKLGVLKMCMGLNEEIKQSCFNVMILIINHEFKHVALESSSLNHELGILAKYKDWEKADCCIVYVIHYLEFMYLGVKHNKSIIVPKLIRTLVRSFPTSPLLRKVHFLLYAAYAVSYNNNDNTQLSNNILKHLEEDSYFEQMLTLHHSQLLWILWTGRYALKIKTLKVWLKMYEQNSDEILICVKYTYNLGLVLDILNNSRDGLFHASLIKLLNNSKDFEVKRLLIATELKSIPNYNFTQCLINMETLTGNELELGMILAKQILCVMQQIQNADMLEYACYYSLELLVKFQKFNFIIFPYMEPKALRLLLKISKSSSDSLASYALNLLKMILQIQSIKKLKPITTIKLDLSEILVGSTKRLSKALNLINSVIKYKHNTPILGLEEPSFSLSHKLTDLTGGACRTQAFKLLGKIMKAERYLAPTVSNKLFVMYECGKADKDSAGFLNFLAIWLWIVRDSFCYYVPKAEIFKYLEKLDGIDNYKVDVLIDLVNKCQAPTPWCTYNRYFN